MFARGSAAAAPGMVMPCHRAPPSRSRGREVERRAGNHGRACRVCGTKAPRRSPLFNSGQAMGAPQTGL